MAKAISGTIMLLVGIAILGLSTIGSFSNHSTWSSTCTTTASAGTQTENCSYSGSTVGSGPSERLFGGIVGAAFVIGGSMLVAGAGSGRRPAPMPTPPLGAYAGQPQRSGPPAPPA